jgi:hypothetical protein
MLSTDELLYLCGWGKTLGFDIGLISELEFPPWEKYLKLLEFKEGVD